MKHGHHNDIQKKMLSGVGMVDTTKSEPCVSVWFLVQSFSVAGTKIIFSTDKKCHVTYSILLNC